MQKTIVVEVTRSVRHPIYGKYIHLKQKYKVHDEKGQYKVGDYVEITEHRPISRDKRWAATKLIERREQG
ncbi:MAG: 30S ribosomal protein S17, partial [Deltaproteobacteria bacterium]|nr:30S ribosomal protein S17 [Deltaproteobacteria bacterium]